MNEVIPGGLNHLGQMWYAFFEVLNISWTIDGFTFTLFDVICAGIAFFVIDFGLYHLVIRHIDV